MPIITARPKTVTTSFAPATHGFLFPNNFVVSANRIGPLPDIHFRGLCGGMSYAALDYFLANQKPPSQHYVPPVGSALEEYIFARQQNSTLGSPANLARWAELGFNIGGIRNAEFYGWGIGERLAELKKYIDKGHPIPLGLKGADGRGDHQVLAIGYQMGRYSGDKGKYQEDLQILLYDPNYPKAVVRMCADPARKNFYYSFEAKIRWQSYFVDSQYKAMNPPKIAPKMKYPKDGLVYEVQLEISTGADDLRGGNDNVHCDILFADGTIQTVKNINGRQRWIDNYSQSVTIRLNRPMKRSDIDAIRLCTTFGGGPAGDNWNVNKVRVFFLENNELNPVFDQSGAPLVRFDGNNIPLTIPLRKIKTTTIGTAHGTFLSAEGGGGRELVANRGAVGAWEKFGYVRLGKHRYAFLAPNGQYVCAEGGGGGNLVANRQTIGTWEIFDVRRSGAKYCIRACNGQYLCAESNGKLVANRAAAGPWELFDLNLV